MSKRYFPDEGQVTLTYIILAIGRYVHVQTLTDKVMHFSIHFLTLIEQKSNIPYFLSVWLPLWSLGCPLPWTKIEAASFSNLYSTRACALELVAFFHSLPQLLPHAHRARILEEERSTPVASSLLQWRLLTVLSVVQVEACFEAFSVCFEESCESCPHKRPYCQLLSTAGLRNWILDDPVTCQEWEGCPCP